MLNVETEWCRLGEAPALPFCCVSSWQMEGVGIHVKGRDHITKQEAREKNWVEPGSSF
jgi:hypothetical protein